MLTVIRKDKTNVILYFEGETTPLHLDSLTLLIEVYVAIKTQNLVISNLVI